MSLPVGISTPKMKEMSIEMLPVCSMLSKFVTVSVTVSKS